MVKSENGYSHYRNYDTRLVEAIKGFRTDRLTLYDSEFVVLTVIEGQYVCKHLDNGRLFIRTESELASDRIYSHLYFLNEEYRASEHFLKNFGIIQREDLKLHGFRSVDDKGRKINSFANSNRDLLLERMIVFEGNSIEYKHSLQYVSCRVYFDADGNYACSASHIPFDLKGEFATKESNIAKFREYVSKIGELEYAGGKWYGSEYMYYITSHYYSSNTGSDCDVSIHRVKKWEFTNIYKNQGGASYKKPKKTEKVGNGHLLDAVLAEIKDPVLGINNKIGYS